MIPFLEEFILANRPSSAQETVSAGNSALERAGMTGARFELAAPPAPGEPFRGAEVRLTLPEKALAEMFHREALRQAAQHGAKISEATLRLEQAGEKAVGFHAKISGSLFPASLQIAIRGMLRAGDSDDLRVTDVGLDAGSGLFAGMARAFIEPHIRKWTDTPVSLRPLTGHPAHWKSFTLAHGAIEGCMLFEEGKPPGTGS